MPTKKNMTTKSTAKSTTKVEPFESITTEVNDVKVDTAPTIASNTTNSSEDPVMKMMKMMEAMNAQLSSLTNELTNTKSELETTKAELSKAKEEQLKVISNVSELEPVYCSAQNSNTSSVAERYIEAMANRKSDKEVTIVHNREIIGGGSTHIKLSNISIDFHSLGETRTLSWAQFEELASKYRGFFKREIILVADKDRSVAEEYVLPCVKRSDGQVLTRKDIDDLNRMSMDELTKLYNSLTSNDKKFLINYWLGQCYSRTPGFYERYKIETLNALSGNGAFDALLAFMNGESINKNKTAEETKNAGLANLIGRA